MAAAAQAARRRLLLLAAAWLFLLPRPGQSWEEPAHTLRRNRRRNLAAAADLPLDTVRLPPGFAIELYTQASFPARFLALGQADAEATVVYVSSTRDVVTALVDRRDGGPVAACTLLAGQDNPNGVAYDPATRALYVAEVRAITRYDGADAAALAGCDPGLLRATRVAGADLLPPQASHANRALAVGPADGRLYVTVAAPFNVDECVDPYCTIHRLEANGSGWEVFARGIRNAAGFDWHGQTGALLWSGMARDRLGDDLPDDVLGASLPDAPVVDYGFPYCHWVGDGPPEERQPGPGSTIPDNEVFPPLPNGQQPSQAALQQRCAGTPPPVQALGPHVAPLGVLYWPGGAPASGTQRWPSEYDGSVFVGEHGSWNRGEKIGYRVSNVKLSPDGTAAADYAVFAEGWLQGGQAWGRPVALLRLPDGSMLLTDDQANVVYRITYDAARANATAAPAPGGQPAAPPPPAPGSAAARAMMPGLSLALLAAWFIAAL